MNEQWLEYLVLLFITLAGVFYAHFLVNRQNNKKEIDDLKEKFVQLSNTAVRETEVKVLIQEAISPLFSTVNEIKSVVNRVETSLQTLELQRAYDKGVQDAISKGAT